MTVRPALQDILKRTPLVEKKDQKQQRLEKNITRNTNSIGNTMALNSHLSIITLNANGLNAQVRRLD